MEKVRVDGRVISIALMLAYGINREGKREILAIEPMFDESEASWREFFRKLKNRGVQKICLCISDAHMGIQNALKKNGSTPAGRGVRSILCATSWPESLIGIKKDLQNS